MNELGENDMNPGERYQLKKIRGKGSYGVVGAYKDSKTGN
jgi:mitogen-activated protein kinase 1/3